MLTVLLGGARSGKSQLAQQVGSAAERSGSPVVLVATAPHIPGDDDLDDRIERHRQDRPASWSTIEEQTDLAGALARAGEAFVIIDCLTVWVGNLLHHGGDEASVLAECDAALAHLARRRAGTIAISNEVGLGIVPEHPLARHYRDLLGRVNQRWVAAADRALLLVAGRAIPLQDPSELLG
jgi:adenosyl cobinamide kinase/adenosyl cobinamide phosphate guanylyltransferase